MKKQSRLKPVRHIKIKPVRAAKVHVQHVKLKPITVKLIKAPTIKITKGSGKNGKRGMVQGL